MKTKKDLTIENLEEVYTDSELINLYCTCLNYGYLSLVKMPLIELIEEGVSGNRRDFFPTVFNPLNAVSGTHLRGLIQQQKIPLMDISSFHALTKLLAKEFEKEIIENEEFMNKLSSLDQDLYSDTLHEVIAKKFPVDHIREKLNSLSRKTLIQDLKTDKNLLDGTLENLGETLSVFSNQVLRDLLYSSYINYIRYNKITFPLSLFKPMESTYKHVRLKEVEDLFMCMNAISSSDFEFYIPLVNFCLSKLVKSPRLSSMDKSQKEKIVLSICSEAPKTMLRTKDSLKKLKGAA